MEVEDWVRSRDALGERIDAAVKVSGNGDILVQFLAHAGGAGPDDPPRVIKAQLVRRLQASILHDPQLRAG